MSFKAQAYGLTPLQSDLIDAFAWANFHGPIGTGCPFRSVVEGIFTTLIGIRPRW